MKAVVVQAPMNFGVETVPDPVVDPAGLLLKVHACGLCGSDSAHPAQRPSQSHPALDHRSRDLRRCSRTRLKVRGSMAGRRQISGRARGLLRLLRFLSGWPVRALRKLPGTGPGLAGRIGRLHRRPAGSVAVGQCVARVARCGPRLRRHHRANFLLDQCPGEGPGRFGRHGRDYWVRPGRLHPHRSGPRARRSQDLHRRYRR